MHPYSSIDTTTAWKKLLFILCPSNGKATSSDIQQLSVDTGCSPEDQPEAMDDREGWRKRVRGIRADAVTLLLLLLLLLLLFMSAVITILVNIFSFFLYLKLA